MKDVLANLSKLLEIVLAEKWKTAAVLMFMVLAIVGSIAYKERELITNRLFSDALQRELDIELFAANAPQLLIQNDANVFILWQVNLDRNQRTSKVVQTLKFGRVAQLENHISPVFTEKAAENDFMLKLLNGQVVCGDLITTSVVGKALMVHDVKWLCRAPVIIDNGLMIGYVTAAYKEPRLKQQPEIEQSLRAVTRALVRTHK